jgi:uncharacterized protein (DUF362 family)
LCIPQEALFMSKKSDDITRREFLEGTAAIAGLAAVGPGCSGDTNATQPNPDASELADSAAKDGAGNHPPLSHGSEAGKSPGAALDGGSSHGSATDAGKSHDAASDRGGADGAPHRGMVAVGIAHRSDVESAVRRAIELAGGIAEIGPGKTVFIKPNAVYGPVSQPAIVTSLAVLTAVIKIVKERSPQRIVVGDRSARGFTTANVFNGLGLAAAALAAGADEVYPAPSPQDTPGDWVLQTPPFFEETWAALGGILAMRKIIEADFLINVPVLKDHRYGMCSLSMKNFMGAIGDASRGPIHYNLGMAETRMGRDIAIFNQIFKPMLSIIDGWDALINGGPEGLANDSVRTTPRLILASRDRVALDATAASLLKLEVSRTKVPTPDQAYPMLSQPGGPWNLPQLLAALDLKLGISGPDQAVLRFDAVPDAAAIEGIFRS